MEYYDFDSNNWHSDEWSGAICEIFNLDSKFNVIDVDNLLLGVPRNDSSVV